MLRFPIASRGSCPDTRRREISDAAACRLIGKASWPVARGATGHRAATGCKEAGNCSARQVFRRGVTTWPPPMHHSRVPSGSAAPAAPSPSWPDHPGGSPVVAGTHRRCLPRRGRVAAAAPPASKRACTCGLFRIEAGSHWRRLPRRDRVAAVARPHRDRVAAAAPSSSWPVFVPAIHVFC